MTNRITFAGIIECDYDEDLVFKAFKQFMYEQFQKFRFEVSGKNKTLKEDTKKDDLA
ncbi:MAG TPA: hypothetical protein VMZ91_15645 [Candidatus Paceibacterota bacterium]|nr:hypothetical protein [Candidatus Paceibacterota bacterium]